MLLYSLLHLTGVQAVDPEVRDARPAVGDARRHQALPPARQQVPRPSGVPLDLRRRDHHRSARPGHRQQRRHGDRRAAGWRAHFNRPGFAAVRLRRLRHLRRRLPDGGHQPRGGVARRPPAARPTCAGSTTTTTSPSRATPRSPSATTSPRASSATAGTSPGSATPTTSTCSARAFDVFKRTDDRPTLIIVDSHIGYGAPHKQDTSAAHGEPLGEDEIRADQAALRLAGGRQVPRPRRRLRALQGRHRRARRRAARRSGWRCFADVQDSSSPSSPTRSSACSGASCPRAGTRTCRPSRPTPRAWPAASRRARC